MNDEERLEQEIGDLKSELEGVREDLAGCEIELSDVYDERDDLLNKLRILEGKLEELWRSI